ncbi:T-complex protein 1 subunit gamma [Tanacetum coccineum]|uniref:T-complex protein 1 subunit gamma n=1 Tax=Tanacetum coccineum TaxID=301880 RepID=A0ABQ4Y1X3_9ASTR
MSNVETKTKPTLDNYNNDEDNYSNNNNDDALNKPEKKRGVDGLGGVGHGNGGISDDMNTGTTIVMEDSLTRESGSKVHHQNIQASKAVADIIRTTLGPRSMLKMLLDASGELDIAHPAAKSMIELSRTQDEEVGDGTTSVIVLAGEMLHVAEAFIDKKYHPTVICRAYVKALEDALAVLDKISMSIDVNDRSMMLGLVKSCIGTKFTSQFGDLIADLALDATTTVGMDLGQGIKEVDIKKYIKVEKIPGGQLEDSKVLKGVMFNKDVVVPGKMKRKIINPRVILLDCPLEYKKGAQISDTCNFNHRLHSHFDFTIFRVSLRMALASRWKFNFESN